MIVSNDANGRPCATCSCHCGVGLENCNALSCKDLQSGLVGLGMHKYGAGGAALSIDDIVTWL